MNLNTFVDNEKIVKRLSNDEETKILKEVENE